LGGDEEVEIICAGGFDLGYISAVFFFLIFILSVTGNVLLLCILVRYENLKKVTNMFVLNLACSDLVFALTLPFWGYYLQSSWVFGDFACAFVTAAYFVGLYSSVILLTAMTVDRFITVVLQKWPSSVKRQRCAMGACAAAWAISIIASVSDAVNAKVEYYGNDSATCEDSHNPESTAVKMGYYLQIALLFFLPFAIIVFCYSAILKTVVHESTRKKHRTVVVVLCIVVVFFICWGPYHIIMLILSLYNPKDCHKKDKLIIIHDIFCLLAYSHCCMNPMLYTLSQKFRIHLVNLFHFIVVMKEGWALKFCCVGRFCSPKC
uniref:G-protein coupled receptors family 1 profile domain-containing protein n=1 Tax=Myripristis murdjan TaxID=586833 RepID=A0A667YCL3_9TELE